ncbi:MAG: class I SAM-dependent methyltransferase [Campylobacterales bacterium]|nr:class I SAM-dependent methyltransferase [Campylobacterales bacterium]
MNNAQHFWNTMFANEEEYLYGTQPNAYIQEKSHLLKPNSHILCLAEGEGRNALHLASLGHRISSIDASDIALQKQKKLLEAHGYTIDALHQDLSHWQPQPNYFDAIATSFMHLPKPLLAQVLTHSITTLKPDALFMGEFFSLQQLQYNSGGPKDSQKLYAIEDFVHHQEGIEFIELKEEIVHLSEGSGHQGEASVIRVLFRKLG